MVGLDATGGGRLASLLTEDRPFIVDVTLREAGLVNGVWFPDDVAVTIAQALDRAAIDVIEVGYYAPELARVRPWGGSCDRRYLERVAGSIRESAIAVMVHVREVSLDAYADLREHRVELVRIVAVPDDAAAVREHVRAAREAGLATSVNVIRASERAGSELEALVSWAAEDGAALVYAADSNGALYPPQVVELHDAFARRTELPLGFHPHDNLRLAFANTLVALDRGFRCVDGSLAGLGKGGGNLVTELVAAHLVAHGGARYALGALAGAAEAIVHPWVQRRGYRAGFRTQLAGLLNLNVDGFRDVEERASRGGREADALLVEALERPDPKHRREAQDGELASALDRNGR